MGNLRYRLAVFAHRLVRRLQWLRTRSGRPARDPGLATPHMVAEHSSLLLRPLKGVDPELQRNKVHNLTLAIAELDGRIVRPGETLSLWRCLGNPTSRRGYLPGLVLSYGSIGRDVGGGLCQLSNLLHWLVLHTPLEVVERHHHGFDVFPDAGREVPFGTGATLFYNYVDLAFRNPTAASFRLELWLDETRLHGRVSADREGHDGSTVVEEGSRFINWKGAVRRENLIYRVRGGERSLLAHNLSPVLYEVDPARVEAGEPFRPEPAPPTPSAR